MATTNITFFFTECFQIHTKDISGFSDVPTETIRGRRWRKWCLRFYYVEPLHNLSENAWKVEI